MVDQHDLALARARVLLAEIAPEIPEDEIIPGAHVADDLGLDLVSVWALATGLEKMAKVEINDADIAAATSLGSLLNHALSDVPLESKAEKFEGIEERRRDDAESQAPSDVPQTRTMTRRRPAVCLEDLADLFNRKFSRAETFPAALQ